MKKIKKILVVLQSINLAISLIPLFLAVKTPKFLLIFIPVCNLIILILLIRLNIQLSELYNQIINLGKLLGLSYSDRKEDYTFSYLIQSILNNLKELKNRELLQKNILHTLMENIPHGILIFNDYNVIDANREFCTIFRITCANAKDISHIFLPAHRDIFLCVKTAINKNKKIECKVTVFDREFKLIIIPIKSSKKYLFVAIFTEKTLEFHLSRIKRALIENMSHELRTPLTIIKGYTEALEEEGANKEFLNKIKSGVEEIENISQNLRLLLDVETRQNIHLHPINVEELCNKLQNKFKQLSHDKGLDFEIQCNLKMCKKPYLDPVAVWTILSNLLDNAIKFTESGKVALYIYEEENHIVFEVTDTGAGIERKHIDRIFERFYRTPEARTKKGHGLGLAIVKHLVTLHRGVIEVKSQKNKGTTFIVKLPCKP